MPALSNRFIASTLLFILSTAFFLPAQAEGEEDPLWNRPSFEKKVITIGQRILSANGITEHIGFYSSTRDIRNATASRWGGPNTVVIYKDLLDVMDSDDELAAILAHEIAHITKRHHGKIAPQRFVAKTALWTTYTGGGTAAILATGGLATAPVVLAGAGLKRLSQNGSGITNPISRPYEREADLVGLDYLAKAGYSPLAMETVMEKIVADAGPVATFFSSHPVGSERLAYIHEAIVQKYPDALNQERLNDDSQQSESSLTSLPEPASHSDSASSATTTQKPESVTPTAIAKHEAPDSKATRKQEASSVKVATPHSKPSPSASQSSKVISGNPARANTNSPASELNSPNNAEPVALTLLSLQPHHLRILRMVSQQGYLSRRELTEQLEYLDSPTRDTAIQDLIQKNLLRQLGGEPDTIVVLTDRAAEAFKPAPNVNP